MVSHSHIMSTVKVIILCWSIRSHGMSMHSGLVLVVFLRTVLPLTPATSGPKNIFNICNIMVHYRAVLYHSATYIILKIILWCMSHHSLKTSFLNRPINLLLCVSFKVLFHHCGYKNVCMWSCFEVQVVKSSWMSNEFNSSFWHEMVKTPPLSLLLDMI